MKIVSTIFFTVIILLGITFAFLNAEPVSINYYLGKQSFPLSLLLVLTFAIGCILGLIVGAVMYLKLKAKNHRLKNRVKLAEKEVSNLRTMPLQDNR